MSSNWRTRRQFPSFSSRRLYAAPRRRVVLVGVAMPNRSRLTAYRRAILITETALVLVLLAFVAGLGIAGVWTFREAPFNSGLFLLGSAALLSEAIKRVRHLREDDTRWRGGGDGQS